MNADLFELDLRDLPLAPGAVVLGGFARPLEGPLLAALQGIGEAAPFRHMVTPRGQPMSVAMTNCGTAGWVSDRTGYRYDTSDPESGREWPPMPAVFRDLAVQAAGRNEQDLEAPIVSVSLGLPAVFLFGGVRRADPTRRVRLTHGDVVVWGGAARLRYHGVLPLREGQHPLMGGHRINLTFRRAVCRG